jgi:Ca2+-binding EF-hand superfamily protein
MSEFDSIFAKYDENLDGKFSKEEFGKICYSMGHYFSASELDAAFVLVDVDGSGYVEREEFIKFWSAWGDVRARRPQRAALLC